MGTSKSFSDTRHAMMPNWSDLSTAVTTSCDSGPIPIEKKKKILRNYVAVIGGANKAGRGGSKIAGKSGIKTAKKIGSFLGLFSSSGNNLRETLENTGLTDLQNKSVEDIINHLIEYCSGTASTIDEVAAKEATRKLLEELVSNAESIDEMEEIFFKAYFTDGKDLNDSQTLIELAVQAGLNSNEVQEVLSDEKLYLNDVHNDITEAQQIGVQGVPFFVFDREKHARHAP